MNAKGSRRSRSARIGHITRHLNNGEPLQGDLLELAIEIAKPLSDDETDIGNIICRKLRDGDPLDEYEFHIFVDVFLMYEKLGR